jgi:apolipoprotein N-acyltransferase
MIATLRQRGALLCLGLTLAAGSLHAAGWLFPGSWYAVWLGQAALIALAAGCSPRRAVAWGTVAGAIGIGSSFYWGVGALRQTFEAAPAVAWTLFVVLVAIEAFGFGLFCGAASLAARRGPLWMWIIPCVWAAIEQWYPRVFPWKLGYSQLEVLPLIQIAELVGPTGIGFVVTAVAAIPAVLYLGFTPPATPLDRHWAIGLASGAAALLVATVTFGQVRLSQWSAWCVAAPKLKLALIQVDPAYVGSELKLRERSLAVHNEVDLLVWPESAVGNYSDALDHFRDPALTEVMSRQSNDLLEPAKGLACQLLAGGKLYREAAASGGGHAMAAFLISPTQDILGRYRKRTLLPFGEYIPGQSWFPAVRQWATLDDVVEAGSDPAPLVTATGDKLGVVICYEDTLPASVRHTVAAGAEALFSLIQGSVFENPLTLVQHERLAALRAVENRRYFVRCASTCCRKSPAPVGVRSTATLATCFQSSALSSLRLASPC